MTTAKGMGKMKIVEEETDCEEKREADLGKRKKKKKGQREGF